MHIDFCSGLFLQSREAAYVIGVRVGQNNVPDIARLLADRRQILKKFILAAWKAAIDERAAIGGV